MDQNAALQMIQQIAASAVTGAPAQPGGLLNINTVNTAPFQTTPLAPAHVTYPAYSIEPSDAYTVAAGAHSFINAALLSTLDQAFMLSQAMGGSISIVNDPNVVYGSSGRKQYLVILPNGRAINVGQALVDEYRVGVGAPGSWDLTDGAQHIWKLNDASGSAWDTVGGVAIL